MDLNACKDDYSRAVVRAIAAAAGVAASVPERDQDSIDLNLVAPDTDDAGGPQLDAQLKCSQNIDPSSDRFSFDLPVKNYNDLRRLPVYVPRLLVLVHVPAVQEVHRRAMRGWGRNHLRDRHPGVQRGLIFRAVPGMMSA